jgi:cephalosporin hydroxylase
MRPFKTPFSDDFLKQYQDGTLEYSYKGIPCLKSPIDLAIYLRLLWQERPASIIEIGSNRGGSALFFADMVKAYGLNTVIYSIDLNIPEPVPTQAVHFLQGDVHNLESVFSMYNLFDLPRPWFVIEDSAHTAAACTATLLFFSRYLQAGEILVMEDGILDELGLSERYSGGPNLAIEEFLGKNPDTFDIAYEYTDMFGINATYNPNGYLRKSESPFQGF